MAGGYQAKASVLYSPLGSESMGAGARLVLDP